MASLIYVVSAFLFSAAATAQQTDANLTFVFVQVVWRHGDRVPLFMLPGSRITAKDWPAGISELTPKGLKQMLKLGNMLHSEYVSPGYLSEFYNSSNVYVRSSDFSRALNSATAVMIGMYHSLKDPVAPQDDEDEDLGWPKGFVPIPVHTVEFAKDHEAIVDSPCDRQEALWSVIRRTAEYEAFWNGSQTAALRRTVARITNISDVDEGVINGLCDFIFCAQQHDLAAKLSPLFTADVVAALKTAADRISLFKDALPLARSVNGLDVRRAVAQIRAGTYFNRLADRLLTLSNTRAPRSVVNSATEFHNQTPKTLKFFGVSAHDATLFSYLAALGCVDAVQPNGNYPSYGASIATELWRNETNGEYLVRVRYSRSFSARLESITHLLTNCCEEFCALQPFVRQARAIRPPGDDIERLCADVTLQ